MTAEQIARALGGSKSGGGWVARCPAHDDHSPSLSINDGGNGKPLVHCHAGCSQQEVIAELKARALWPERPRPEWTAAQRRQWVDQHARFRRDLATARYWRYAALALGAAVLDGTKVGVELQQWTAVVADWKRFSDTELVAEYRWWRDNQWTLTRALVAAGQASERRQQVAILKYLEVT